MGQIVLVAFLVLIILFLVDTYWHIIAPILIVSFLLYILVKITKYIIRKKKEKKQKIAAEVKECADIVSKCSGKIKVITDPFNFDEYYDSIIDAYNVLLKHEKFVKPHGFSPRDELRNIKNIRKSEFESFVIRTCIKAEQVSKEINIYSDRIKYLESTIGKFKIYQYGLSDKFFDELFRPIDDLEKRLLKPLKNMDILLSSITDGYEFEIFIANLLLKNGFDSAETTKKSGDYGADVIAEKDKIRYAIQCKFYSQPVSNKAVQEVFSAKQYYGCHVSVVATNSRFTNSAIELANITGTLLWDRDKIMEFIKGSKPETVTLKTIPQNIQIDIPSDTQKEDDIYQQTVSFVKEAGTVTVSSLQRKMRIGYRKSSRILETLCSEGLIEGYDKYGSQEYRIAE